jgi:hypothetical protein
MYYITNIRDWLTEVIQKCNARGLDPIKATFMFAFFSSLDRDYVEYFKTNHLGISSYSDENFHILCPIIYEGGTIPDGELRDLRKQFKEGGIPVTNKPNLLFFFLREAETGYRPVFFAGFEVPNFKVFEGALRDIIDLTLESVRREPGDDVANEFIRLQPRFSERLKAKNYVIKSTSPDIEIVQAVESNLPTRKVFISHSRHDKPVVHKLMEYLSYQKIDAWLDDDEIQPGDKIRKRISDGLKGSSALVVVISPNSISSEWVRYEIAQFVAGGANRKIIPVLVGAKVSDLPTPFRELQDFSYVDLSDPDDWHENIERLASALK